MKLFLIQRLLSYRLHFSLGMLMLVLQRAPVLKMIAYAKYLQPGAPVIRILQSAALPAAALAVPHAVSGASTSTYDVEYINTPELKVGVEAVIKFSNTITPKSWTVSGQLPPGLRITDLRLRKSVANGVIATDVGIITGTPTLAGTYDLVLTPWSNEDGTGETAPEPNPGALRLRLVVMPSETNVPTAPDIRFSHHEGGLTLSWQTADATGFQLAKSDDLQVWEPLMQTPSLSNGESSITIPNTDSTAQFYRLEPSN